MRFRRPANSCRRWILTFVVGAALVTLAGCNSAPFHSAVLPGGAKSALSQGKGAEGAAVNDAGWPGDTRSADSDQKAQYHEVRAGETLQSLSTMYGLSVSRLVLVNGLDSAEGLKPGQLLYIPRSP